MRTATVEKSLSVISEQEKYFPFWAHVTHSKAVASRLWMTSLAAVTSPPKVSPSHLRIVYVLNPLSCGLQSHLDPLPHQNLYLTSKFWNIPLLSILTCHCLRLNSGVLSGLIQEVHFCLSWTLSIQYLAPTLSPSDSTYFPQIEPT